MAAPAADSGAAPAASTSARSVAVIVDLAIVIEHLAAIGREHRLVARRRQVDDRQPAMAEADAALAVDPDALVIRSPVLDRARHPREQLGLRRIQREYACNPTHRRLPSTPERTARLSARAPDCRLDCRLIGCSTDGTKRKRTLAPDIDMKFVPALRRCSRPCPLLAAATFMPCLD